jgi:hypothetical protein
MSSKIKEIIFKTIRQRINGVMVFLLYSGGVGGFTNSPKKAAP